MNVTQRRGILAAVLMVAALAAAQAMTPTHKLAAKLGRVDLAGMMPMSFGGWHVDTTSPTGVVDPTTAAALDRIYSQTLSRTYVNAQGQRIMVSIAYGEDQRDKTTTMHYPEICYPAQGFELMSNQKGVITTAQGQIPVRRLESRLSNTRYEPVTYWTMIGDNAAVGSVPTKLAEWKYGLHGDIPDGLLFRVSSIDRNSTAAFDLQQRFVADLVRELPGTERKRLAGL